MISTVAINGTTGYLAVMLRRMSFGPVAWIAYAFVITGLAWIARASNVLPFVIVTPLLGGALHIIHRFLRERLENDGRDLPPATPMAARLSHALMSGLAPARAMTPGMLLDAAAQTTRGSFIAEEMGMTPQQIVARLWNDAEEHVELQPLLQEAWRQAERLGEKRIDANVILLLMLTSLPSGRMLLNDADLSEEELTGLLSWETFHHHFRRKPRFWEPESLAQSASVGRSWVMGYTDALDALTTEVNTHLPTAGEESVRIHQAETEAALRVLSRSTRKNLLLLGDVGTGKKTMAKNIARALRARERAQHLPFTRVLEFQTEVLLSGTHRSDALLLKALSRARSSGRFVLVIRDMAQLIGAADAPTRAVLATFLETDGISVIGIADTQQYHDVIKQDSQFDSLFEKIPVESATKEETMIVLMAHYFSLGTARIRMTYKVFRLIVELAERYLGSRGGLPGKALAVMDDALSRAREAGEATVSEQRVREVVSLQSRVNVQKMTEEGRERLRNLEERLRTHVIGQEAALRAVSAALKRATLDLHDRKKPLGTFLFLGPTGVGKTQTAKAVAQEFYGAPDAFIRLDMNEYSHPDSVFALIGSSMPGAPSEGFLSRRVQDAPFSLLLLDEIEKAHPSVLNLFLQILDEGILNDARGVRTDFRNTIIIATSNAGALFIRDMLKHQNEMPAQALKQALTDVILKERLFSPEFINRFDELVLFSPLSAETARIVAEKMVGEVIDDIHKKRGIIVQIGPGVLDALAERGYSREFGAREMKRTVTGVMEDYLAEYLLQQDVKRGDTIRIEMQDLRW